MLALTDVKERHMTRTSQEVQDAVALLKAVTMMLNVQGNQNLFGNALDTLYAAVLEIEVNEV
jgi:hypothetical protein